MRTMWLEQNVGVSSVWVKHLFGLCEVRDADAKTSGLVANNNPAFSSEQ